MNAEVFPRLVRVIHEQHLDGLLAVSPENVAYVLGFPFGGLGEPRWRQAAALVTWDGRTALLCVDAHAEAVRRRMRAETVVRSWGEFGDNPTHILADLLTEFHLSQSRIGTELDSLSADELSSRIERLQASLGLPGESLVAHGIGLASVEEPFLGPFPEPRVEADMILAVGPAGTTPWPLRDIVLVTPEGPELLTYRSRSDRHRLGLTQRGADRRRDALGTFPHRLPRESRAGPGRCSRPELVRICRRNDLTRRPTSPTVPPSKSTASEAR